MRVSVNLTGGDYQHKSRPLSNQVTRNFWPQVQGTQKARSQYILQSFYGLKAWASQSGGVDRGMLFSQGVLYKVTGTTLYSVSATGIHTALGFIAGSNRCIIKAIGSQIIVNNGSRVVYVWDGSTLSQVTDVNIGLPRGVAVINNQAIYDSGDGQGFDVSDVGTPGTINGLNNAAAESDPDNLLLPYGYRETLYLMGVNTIEPWWNSGQGNPPFDKIQGGTVNIGLGAIYSVADNPDYIFLLGSDRQVYTLTGGTSAVQTVISTPALAKIFKDYTVVSDAVGWMMELEGQWFYVLTFPTQNVTWVYPVGGEWFQWGSSATGRIRANSYARAYNKDLVADYNSGVIYELDAETYTDADEPVIRTRDSAPLHAGLLKQDGKEFEFSELEIILETGVGLVSGQGSNPMMAVSTSRDGGKTFGTERFIKVGRLNDTRKVARLKNLGRFSSCVIRIRVSDPIYWAIYSATADIEVCI